MNLSTLRVKAEGEYKLVRELRDDFIHAGDYMTFGDSVTRVDSDNMGTTDNYPKTTFFRLEPINDMEYIQERYAGLSRGDLPFYVLAIRWAQKNKIELPTKLFFDREISLRLSEEFDILYDGWINNNWDEIRNAK